MTPHDTSDGRSSGQDPLRLRAVDSGQAAELDAGYSNAPTTVPAERGGPLGGLMAALAADAARRTLQLNAPLRTLSVQFLSAAKFRTIQFHPHLLRGGRNLAFVSVIASQGAREVLRASALFADDREGPSRSMIADAPRPLGTLPIAEAPPPEAPWFHQRFEYRLENGATTFEAAFRRTKDVRVWVRPRDGATLDEGRICMLLDAIFPSFWALAPPPRLPAVTASLSYEFLEPLPPGADGWVFIEQRTEFLGGGWAIEDARAFAQDGRPLAIARQRRRLVLPP